MRTERSTMKIGGKEFLTTGETYIMGILNVTPDSFSDGGSYNNVERAVQKALEMETEGADLIDLGGESTRPGHTVISDEEEIERVLPVLAAIKKVLKIPVSIDTYKYKVAKAAADNGADLINDVYGFKREPKIAKLCAERTLPCCLMHNRDNRDYGDLLADMKKDLQGSIELALSAGVGRDQIIIDPGIGFAKGREMNIEVLKRLHELQELGYPILLGASRKSFIGDILGLPADERTEGTLVTSVLAAAKGCMFVRVHDVKENKRACMVADRLFRDTD